jgi:YidC/Oxa1 family membrane protein insertase
MNNNENFIAAVILSIAILVGFHYFYEKPQMEKMQQVVLQQQAEELKPAALAPVIAQPRAREDVLKDGPRVAIETPELRGSINLKGARLDDLSLVNYRETVDPSSPQIVLLSPAGSAAPHLAYYASFGWLASAGVAVPDDETVWTADAKVLTPAKPLRLTWDNGKGLVFERTIALDEHFFSRSPIVFATAAATP